MMESILGYVVCPVCLNSLELQAKIERRVGDDITEGKLECLTCDYDYLVTGGIPILTTPGTKPYDWFSMELTRELELFKPREALRRISDDEITSRRLTPSEPILTPEELREGEYKDSEKFLKDMFGSIEKARDHFGRQHDHDRSIFNVMMDRGHLDNADVILDIGTGYGYMVQFLAERYKSPIILSIDISYTNLKAVRGRLRILGIDNVHLVAGDALQPPFRNDQFDSIESCEGLGNIVKGLDMIGLWLMRRIRR